MSLMQRAISALLYGTGTHKAFYNFNIYRYLKHFINIFMLYKYTFLRCTGACNHSRFMVRMSASSTQSIID